MTQTLTRDLAALDEDHRALATACEPGVALCTIVGIEGSFSRRPGAQLAIRPDGSTVGDLADTCLEKQIASDVAKLGEAQVVRYGRGSSCIDFRLPCGGGLDILLDPEPDREACRAAIASLGKRTPAKLALHSVSPLATRHYIPRLAIRPIGEGPELTALERLAHAAGIETETCRKCDLSLGRPTGLPLADRWTAVVFLFHDHEWELALIEEALESEAFYIGAQGGERARNARTLDLLARGVDEGQLARLTSPVGIIPACKSPGSLALSVLGEIVGRYEALRTNA